VWDVVSATRATHAGPEAWAWRRAPRPPCARVYSRRIMHMLCCWLMPPRIFTHHIQITDTYSGHTHIIPYSIVFVFVRERYTRHTSRDS